MDKQTDLMGSPDTSPVADRSLSGLSGVASVASLKDTKGRDLIEGAWYAVFGTDAYDCQHESLVEWNGVEFVTEDGEPDDGYEFDYRAGLRAQWGTAVLQNCRAATAAGVAA